MQETETVPITDDATETPSLAGPPAAAKPSLYDYPESDGKPMAETPWHMDAMVDAIRALKEHFRDLPRRDVYVAGNMMMYYVEDDTRTSVSPDVFVTFGVPSLPERRVWRTWTEGGRFADFVLEVTSKSTRREDERTKKALYAKLGVREYWQFDPEGDYLDPMLKGHRLDPERKYLPLVLDERDGALGHASLLGLELRLDGDRLRFFDPAGRAYLPTQAEIVRARAEAEAAREKAEAARDQEARRRRGAEAARDREARGRRDAEAGRDAAQAALRAAESEIADLKRRTRRSRD